MRRSQIQKYVVIDNQFSREIVGTSGQFFVVVVHHHVSSFFLLVAAHEILVMALKSFAADVVANSCRARCGRAEVPLVVAPHHGLIAVVLPHLLASGGIDCAVQCGGIPEAHWNQLALILGSPKVAFLTAFSRPLHLGVAETVQVGRASCHEAFLFLVPLAAARGAVVWLPGGPESAKVDAASEHALAALTALIAGNRASGVRALKSALILAL